MTVVFKKVPTKEEQIEALIGNNEFFVQEFLDSEKTDHKTCKDIEAYNKALFTVTRSEILSYVKEHYSLEDLGLYDKKCYLNLKKKGKKYIIYTWNYEYEMRTGEVTDYQEEYYDTEDEVYERFVDHVIGSSGTGLSFADKSE